MPTPPPSAGSPAEFLRNQRKTVHAEAQAVVAVAEQHRRDLSPNETARFNELRAEIARLDGLIADAEADDARIAQAQQLRASFGGGHTENGRTGGARITGEAHPYTRGDHRRSWIKDMASVALGRDGASEARDRLQSNNRAAELELRALNTTDGAGGDFVPPVWLVKDFIELARASRPVADRVQNQPMPPGTDTINVPRLSTGTAVAEQATQNTPIQNTDATTGTATAAVATLAGAQVISVQMLEQSPINVDEMLLADLLADYAAKVDSFVLNNAGANKNGILQTAGILTQTYTDASPTTAKLYIQIAQAISAVQQNRFAAPDTVVMHPRRWAAFQAASDSNGRPLVLPTSSAPQNALGVQTTTAASGIVGVLQGLAVITDPLLPTNIGAGTNQDPVIVFKAGDVILYEGAPRAEAFREPKADTLSIYLRVYNYVAVLSRFPKSICVVSGTGLVTPTYGA